MTKQLSTLLQKEMTRKEFLTTVAIGAGTALGFGSIIKLFSGQQQQPQMPIGAGYGSGPYGGSKI